MNILGGAALGYLTGGGIELGKQLIQGQKVDWEKVNAKAMNGAIVGGAAGATGGLSLGWAAASMGVAGMAGGVVERASDGDQSTNAWDGKLMIVDGVLGTAFGGAAKYSEGLALQEGMTGPLRQQLTRGESLINNGLKNGDLAKVAKGEATKAAAEAAAVKAGNKAAAGLVASQEVAGEVTSQLRQEERRREQK